MGFLINVAISLVIGAVCGCVAGKIMESSGTTEITCDKKLVIKVGQGATIEVDGTAGSIKIKANKDISIEAAQLAEKASGTAEISANGSLEVKSSGMLTVKGSMTKRN